MGANQQAIRRLCRAAAAARIEQTTTGVELGKKDFMTWLTNDADPNKDVSMDEIKEEAILLITAGKQ